MVEVSFWPILAAAVSPVLIGWVWYHPSVFGAAWMRMSGITPEMAERGKKRMPLVALIGFLAATVVAYVMSHFGIAWGVYDWIGAIQLGFWSWAGFVAPTMLGTVLWDQRPLRLYCINACYWLVALVVMAIILVAGSQTLVGTSFYDEGETPFISGE